MSELIKRAKLRLAYLGIGLMLGLLISAVIGGAYNEVMKLKEKEYELKITHLQELSQMRLTETKRLLVENEKLRTTRIERKNADGSSEVVESTASDTSRKETEMSREISMLEHTIKTMRKEHKAELQAETKKRPSLTAHMGLTTRLIPYGVVTYNVTGNVIVGAYVDKAAEFGLGIGLQF